jgi:hypothetical protein
LTCLLALGPASGLARVPLGPEPSQSLAARIAESGFAFDVSRAAQTFQDPAILYVPALGDLELMLLHDTRSGRAVAVQVLGAEGLRFELLDPGHQPRAVELQMKGDGSFGPEERLAELGLDDAKLAAAQARLCAGPCLERVNLIACASCTAAGLLVSLRGARPAPGPAPGAAQDTAALEPGEAPSPWRPRP